MTFTEIEEISSDEIWTTKEGRKILISELEDSHLANIIAMINRKFSDDTIDLIRLQFSGMAEEAAAMMSGDMAVWLLEREAEACMSWDDDEAITAVIPQWLNLIEEQAKRERERES